MTTTEKAREFRGSNDRCGKADFAATSSFWDKRIYTVHDTFKALGDTSIQAPSRKIGHTAKSCPLPMGPHAFPSAFPFFLPG